MSARMFAPRNWPRPDARWLLFAACLMAMLPPPIALPGWVIDGKPGPALLINPVLGIALFGGWCVCAWLWRTSKPVALLVGWAITRTLVWGPTERAIWCLLLILGMAALYKVTAELPARADGILMLVVLGFSTANLLIGYLDLVEKNPLMVQVGAELRGLPMGFLAHPNHFGLFMALSMPLALTVSLRYWPLQVAGPMMATVFLAAAVLSRSRVGAAATLPALAWLASWMWIAFPRKVARQIVPCFALAVLLGVGLCAWWINPRQIDTLGGRMGAWTVGAVDLSLRGAEHLAVGSGLGSWSSWALHPQGRLRAQGVPELGILPQNKQAGWWTEAHNEPLQLLFEQGWIGLALGILAAAQVFANGVHWFREYVGPGVHPEHWQNVLAWRAWSLVAATGLLASLFTPVFHHGALGLLVVMAAARSRR